MCCYISHKSLTLLDEFRVCFDLDRHSHEHWPVASVCLCMASWLARIGLVKSLTSCFVVTLTRILFHLTPLAWAVMLVNLLSSIPSEPWVWWAWNVSGKILEILLAQTTHCLFVWLVVQGCYDLINLQVSGPSLAMLQHLEIVYCTKLKSVIFWDTNLVSLQLLKRTL